MLFIKNYVGLSNDSRIFCKVPQIQSDNFFTRNGSFILWENLICMVEYMSIIGFGIIIHSTLFKHALYTANYYLNQNYRSELLQQNRRLGYTTDIHRHKKFRYLYLVYFYVVLYNLQCLLFLLDRKSTRTHVHTHTNTHQRFNSMSGDHKSSLKLD